MPLMGAALLLLLLAWIKVQAESTGDMLSAMWPQNQASQSGEQQGDHPSDICCQLFMKLTVDQSLKNKNQWLKINKIRPISHSIGPVRGLGLNPLSYLFNIQISFIGYPVFYGLKFFSVVVQNWLLNRLELWHNKLRHVIDGT